MIISRTPYRISFFGGGTDYPDWYAENGGKVLTSTINKYCYISARYLPPFFDKKNRIVWSTIELVNKADEIAHPVVREALKFCNIQKGVEIHHNGDLPARSGIGSSSAFTVGLLHALHGLNRELVNKSQLANEAIEIEQKILKEAVGIQDQIAVAHGGINLVEIRQDGAYYVQPILMDKAKIEYLQSCCMMFFTGISRYSSEVAAEQIKAIPSKNIELRELGSLVDVAIECIKAPNKMDELGMLLHESWLIKKSLTSKISNQEIDDIYSSARNSGALGGKLLGAGGGGFILLFVKPENQDKVRATLNSYLEVPFLFDHTGSQIIFCDN
jgi:D-glycero-alpha-D-manno-heptose-7-phosphate kinase